MKKFIWPMVGLVLGFIVSACATSSFPYTVYGLSLKDTIADSMLLAPTGSTLPDISLTTCEPSATSVSPCVTMLTTQYIAWKEDYTNTQNQLVACQQQLRNLQ